MKFDSQLIRILKNFSTINKSILFKPGNLVSTVEPNHTVLAKATVTEAIPSQFAIFDLPQFIGVLSLFNDPEVEIGEQSLRILEGKESVTYRFAALETITYPTKEPEVNEPDVTVALTSDQLSKLLKAAAVLGAPEVVVRGKDGKLSIGAGSSKDRGKDGFTIDLGETDKTFEFYIKVGNVKAIPADYKLTVYGTSKVKCIQLTNEVLNYFIVVEAKESTWQG